MIIGWVLSAASSRLRICKSLFRCLLCFALGSVGFLFPSFDLCQERAVCKLEEAFF